MNLPNSLTITRIFLVPLLVVVLLTKVKGPLILGLPKDIAGAMIFALASLTDWAKFGRSRLGGMRSSSAHSAALAGSALATFSRLKHPCSSITSTTHQSAICWTTSCATVASVGS